MPDYQYSFPKNRIYIQKMNLAFYYRMLKAYSLYRIGINIPIVVNLLINTNCNLKCNFCNLWKTNPPQELDATTVTLLINDLAKIGIPGIVISGGEPLLVKDIHIVGQYATQKRIITTINTNATLITKTKASLLNTNFDMIKVSIEGNRKTNDKIRGAECYDQTIQGIKFLAEQKHRRAKIIIHIVITEDNKNQITSMVKYFENKVDSITIMPYIKSTSVYDHPEFVKTWEGFKSHNSIIDLNYMIRKPDLRIGKRYCGAARQYLYIKANGDVIPCSFKHNLLLGNINNERFFEIWRRGTPKKVLKEIKRCKGCFDRCTTQTGILIQQNPLRLLCSLPKLMRHYKF
jgi:AdoMet-dependent heme synthase